MRETERNRTAKVFFSKICLFYCCCTLNPITLYEPKSLYKLAYCTGLVHDAITWTKSKVSKDASANTHRKAWGCKEAKANIRVVSMSALGAVEEEKKENEAISGSTSVNITYLNTIENKKEKHAFHENTSTKFTNSISSSFVCAHIGGSSNAVILTPDQKENPMHRQSKNDMNQFSRHLQHYNFLQSCWMRASSIKLASTHAERISSVIKLSARENKYG